MKKAVLSNDFKVLAGMMAVIILPTFLTLLTVSLPRTPLNLAENPTPRGYTWSLTLFIIPVVVLAVWLTRRRESQVQKRAFWITTLAVTCSGIFLDMFFGLTFFKFPNKIAVCGLRFYGYSFTNGWQQVIPIEELGFYLFGTLAVLLVYIWGDEFWFGAYNVDDMHRRRLSIREIPSFHLGSAIIAAVVYSAGLAYKKFAPSAVHEGPPGYLLFLTAVALAPSIVLFPAASRFINWRAFSLGLMFILLISLFWEATIAVPYQWWDFQDAEMIGIRINGFSRLPIEEPALWLGVTWAVVILYETAYTLLYLLRVDHPPTPAIREEPVVG